MTLDTILTELKAERDRLDQAIAALEGTTAAGHGRKKAQSTKKPTAVERCGAKAPE